MAGTQIGAEIAIDVCCATIAEVRKRGEKFWGEFEFYLSDLAVGMVLDIVLVTLLAPVAVIGKYPKAVESTGESVAIAHESLGLGKSHHGLGTRCKPSKGLASWCLIPCTCMSPRSCPLVSGQPDRRSEEGPGSGPQRSVCSQ